MSRHNPPLPAQPHSSPSAKTEDDAIAEQFAEISRKVPKRPLILFFGRATFSDNTKYLYLAAVKAADALGSEVLWCTFEKNLCATLRQHGLPCFDLSADLGRSIALLIEAAAAVFCENLNNALRSSGVLKGCLAGAHKIQLWHGVSVKQLDLMLIPHFGLTDPAFRRQLRFAIEPDHFLSPAAALDGFWVRAYGCTSLVRAGYPRNEVVVRPAAGAEWLGAELPPAVEELLRADRKRRLLLVPTWPRGQTPLFTATPACSQRLAAWAAANDAVVFVKPHPFLSRLELPPDVPGRVHHLPGGVDVYPWLSCFDALITDYSSIMFDFLLLHRPIFTLNTRTAVSWGFEPDYSLLPPGEFRYEFEPDNLEAVLERHLVDHPLQPAQRALSPQLFETPPTDACARLLSFVATCSNSAVDKRFTVHTPQPASQPLRLAV